jgi:hypothetical protein
MSAARSLLTLRYLAAPFSLGFALLVPHLATAQDQCKDVLAGGVRSVFKMNETRSDTQNTSDWICSDNFTTFIDKQSAGFNLTVPIDGVPVGFGGKSDNSKSFAQRNAYCAKANRQLTSNETTSVWRQLVDQPVIDAWTQCMVKNSISGAASPAVRMLLTDVGGVVVAVGSFVPAFSDQRAPLVFGFDVTGLTCSRDRLKNGAELTIQGLAETCTRKPNEDSVAVLLTSLGYAKASLKQNLDGKDAGTATLAVVGIRQDWVKVGNQVANATTADHDQTGNKNPTRFPGGVELQMLPPNQQYRNFVTPPPCGGIGCPWSRGLGDIVVDNGGRHASYAFEVWGRPITITLQAEVWELRDFDAPVPNVALPMKYNRTIAFTVPKRHRTAFLTVNFSNGRNTIIDLDSGASASPDVMLQSRQEAGDIITFTYEIREPS